ncbi:MAG: hypothetical protein PUG48_00405 [Clostridia bacterium]|nr:hypothetical protein [Clostridia bacterium]
MDFKDKKQKNPCEQTEEQEMLNDEELEQVGGGYGQSGQYSTIQSQTIC